MPKIITNNGHRIDLPESKLLSELVRREGNLDKLISIYEKVGKRYRDKDHVNQEYVNSIYHKYSHDKYSALPEGVYNDTISILDDEEVSLTPEIITDFTREVRYNPDLKGMITSTSGYYVVPFFLSGLISSFQNQHPAQEDIVTFDVRRWPEKLTNYLGHYVHEANLEIIGNVKRDLGEKSKNSTFTIYGDVYNYPGNKSESSNFFIFGDLKDSSIPSSYFSKIFVDGNFNGENDPEKVIEDTAKHGYIESLLTELYIKHGDAYVKVWPIVSDELKERMYEQFLEAFKYGDKCRLQEEESIARHADSQLFLKAEDIIAQINRNERDSIMEILSMAYGKNHKEQLELDPVIEIAEGVLSLHKDDSGTYVTRKPQGLIEKSKSLLKLN